MSRVGFAFSACVAHESASGAPSLCDNNGGRTVSVRLTETGTTPRTRGRLVWLSGCARPRRGWYTGLSEKGRDTVNREGGVGWV
eukprot:498399-Prorocentrum_minimum.AAC.2